DPDTRAVFADILRDESFHMGYTQKQLARVAGPRKARRLFLARAQRVWRAYLRVAVAIAAMLGTAVLIVQYFVLLPPFAFLARRAERRERRGWQAARTPTP